MKFVKMHGCGNDYIYIDGAGEKIKDKPGLAIRLSDRHFGIGGDGVIFINPSEIADFEMEMYNADGSRGKMCGNGIRCVGKYVYDQGLTRKKKLTIESCGSIKTLWLHVEEGKVDKVRVDMGEPILDYPSIPADPAGTEEGPDEENRLIDVTYSVDGKKRKMTAVSMGNPHAVLYCDDVDHLDLTVSGPFFEQSTVFPEGVNTEFAQVIDKKNIKMRVWERGSGETWACGTGACACLAASVLNGKTDRKATIHLLGGKLEIEWDESDNHIYMTGPAVTVFHGETENS